jgi:hypothetical protein
LRSSNQKGRTEGVCESVVVCCEVRFKV